MLSYCKDGCCILHTQPYMGNKLGQYPRIMKAGIFIYDPHSEKILLVQSRGNRWGPPKGTKNCKESYLKCAIREVKEETGIILRPCDIKFSIYIRKNVTFYYVEMKECEVTVQTDIRNNDANGIAWINKNCLVDMVNMGTIYINWYCRYLLRIIFKIKLKNKQLYV